MNSYSHTYPGRKCSRHHRFPALPQDGARVIISAHRCYLAGNSACLLAPIIKPESLRSLTRELPQVDKKCFKVALKWSKSSSREPEAVTMCRKRNIGVEMVKQDHAETGRVHPYPRKEAQCVRWIPITGEVASENESWPGERRYVVPK
jgi:hypothetical protein